MTTAEKIYRALKKKMITGAIAPTTILTERELADFYQVSKSPVREALRRLVAESFLVSYPRKGYIQNILTEKDYHQIQEVRLPLEELVLQLVSKKATKKELTKLLQQNHSDELDPYHSANTNFHLQLAKLSGNQYLYDSLESLLASAARAFILKTDKTTTTGTSHHQEIVEQLLQDDLDQALIALKEDLSQDLY